MGASEGQSKCMNPIRHCPVELGEQYCSQHCEAEAERGRPVSPCQCGHPVCEEART